MGRGIDTIRSLDRLLLSAIHRCRNVLGDGLLDFFTYPAKAGSFWNRIVRGAYSPEDPKIQVDIPQQSLATIFPEIGDTPVTLVDYIDTPEVMPINELLTVCQLVHLREPKVIFEIGTFLGGTTLQLAANSQAEVYTLDLPPRGHKEYRQPQVWDPELDLYPDQPGVRFRGSTWGERIHQLFGNSQDYNFTPYYGSVDFVFVDGCHHYEFVMSDSQNALKMMSANGIIIWHDYATYAPGVVQALNELSKLVPLVHIAGTSLVIHTR